MNIFYFDNNPVKCAKMHCDKHTVKMIVEYAQILSTVHRLLDGKMDTIIQNGRKKKVWIHPDMEKDSTLYSATHYNHPSVKWAMHSKDNYIWLVSLWNALCCEYTYRYDKIHATQPKLQMMFGDTPKNIADTGFCSPWRAMPDQYKLSKDIDNYCELSYQAYFNGEKQHIASWKNREIPVWFKPIE
jgi:hypothetical protein